MYCQDLPNNNKTQNKDNFTETSYGMPFNDLQIHRLSLRVSFSSIYKLLTSRRHQCFKIVNQILSNLFFFH